MDCLYEFTNYCSVSFHKATKNGGGREKTSKFVYLVKIEMQPDLNRVQFVFVAT